MEKIAESLGIPKEKLEKLEKVMVEKGFEPALERVAKENEELIEQAFGELGVSPDARAEAIRKALARKVEEGDNELYRFLGIDRNNFVGAKGSSQVFQKVGEAAKEIATESEGFFLKKEYAKKILKQRPPEDTMRYLGYTTVEDMLGKEDVGEVFSALRFTETDEWMHETFEVAYTKFTPDDFEHRPIELRVLGLQWKEIAQKYVAKKHHNVSHLKEFGIIFLNPIAQTESGKFLRDFALLLHYFHEVAFYSKLFERYAKLTNFNEKFISLLRGDVPEAEGALQLTSFAQGKWLIVQRYLWKENPQDPRLFLPRVNPEAMHWRKAQKDLVEAGRKNKELGLEFWDELDWVDGIFPNARGERELVSFDMEDNAMGVASASDGKNDVFFYHQREALWNKIFATYVGGYENLERYTIENMKKGHRRLLSQ